MTVQLWIIIGVCYGALHRFFLWHDFAKRITSDELLPDKEKERFMESYNRMNKTPSLIAELTFAITLIAFWPLYVVTDFLLYMATRGPNVK